MKKMPVKAQLPLHDQNHLFAALPEKTKERLRAVAEPVLLKRDEVLIGTIRHWNMFIFQLMQ